MKNGLRVAVWMALLFVLATMANAGSITLVVVPSVAPNVYGSPSWGAYATNALNSLENGLGDIGDRSVDPTAYKVAGPVIHSGDLIVTSSNSWRGDLSPTGAFAGEYGNRPHFGLHAYGDGLTQFRLEDLSFEMTSSDPIISFYGGSGALGYEGDFVGLNYNGTTRYGVDWGADNAKGGGDDTYYTSGNGTTFVDEIVYVGVGNAWWPDSTPEGIRQINRFIGFYQPYSVDCTYDILGQTGYSSVDVVVPLPISSAMALAGIALVAIRRRRLS